MSVSYVNPYSGQEEETCSVSFDTQQQVFGTVGSAQTEAEFHKSKFLGELGVLEGKLQAGQIPDGTKVVTFTVTTGSRGYYYVKNGALWTRRYNSFGKQVVDKPSDFNNVQTLLNGSQFSMSIPQSVAPKPEPEPVPLDAKDFAFGFKAKLTDGQKVAVQVDGTDYITWSNTYKEFTLWTEGENKFVKSFGDPSLKKMVNQHGGQWAKADPSASGAKPKTVTPSPPTPQDAFTTLTPGKISDGQYIYVNGEWVKVDHKTMLSGGGQIAGTLKGTYSFFDEKGNLILSASPNQAIQVRVGSKKETTQVAAPTVKPAVDPSSTSVGSMSDEDVSAMFVKIKDDLAKEKGLNIKGANADLDALVHQAIGDQTGYTADEVYKKIQAYKATGAKLSALKKKVLAGTYPVPKGKPVKPNGVPTAATPKVANAAKEEVKAKVEEAPKKVYSDEDIAAQYIMRKDEIVAASNGKWTLYTKSDEMELEIAIQIGLKTGLNPLQQKQAIANYLGSGKKLSVLKKQLIKQGAFEKKADTLKLSGKAKTDAEKQADISTKAAAGYTPTSTPATGTPKVDTGKPAPKKVERADQQSGDISGIEPGIKKTIFTNFKLKGAKTYLSSSNESVYSALVETKAYFDANGHEHSLLQIIRIIDDEGAKKAGVDNGHLFEEKIVNWLTTPEGAQAVLNEQTKVAKQLEVEKKKAEAAKLAKELQDKQPPLPADSALYEDWSLEKARRVSKTWLEEKPWTPREQRDLKHYTGGSYSTMNNYLRGSSTSIDERNKNAIEGAKAGMRPTTERILVRRGTGLSQFRELGLSHGDQELVWGLTGKTFKDGGFLSTSAGGRAAFSGEALLEVECPIGTPMAYVAPISNFPSENEMLLQAGMEYKILQVRRENGRTIFRMRVVNWPGKVN